MSKTPPKVEMRIINTTFPRFVVVDAGRRRYWTGNGWSRNLRQALLFAHADLLHEAIETLKKNCS
jgi:hypothetical protein